MKPTRTLALLGSLVLGVVACAERGAPKPASQDAAQDTATDMSDDVADTGSEEGDEGEVDDDDCEAPSPRRLRRLSHLEYRHSLQDLFDVDIDDHGSLASDPSVDGFDNDAEALVVGTLLADQYRNLAESVALSADLSPWTTCDLSADSCRLDTIDALGRSLWRRPLSAAELSTLDELAVALALDETAEAGLRWTLVAMLQSPHFLYRAELGVEDASGTYLLDDWERATVLSYQLWGTTPDEALLDAADSGALSTEAGLQAELERMLEDPRAAEQLADLVEAWLHLDLLDTVSRVDLTDTERAQMRAELRSQVIDQMDGTTDSLLADGLMLSPALLTAHGVPEGSGPVQRGVMVRELLLCEHLPPPPSGIDTSAPEVDPTQTTREQVNQHAEDPTCAGCHDRIDPLGFAFEHYDQLGQWRDTDRGLTIDDSGNLDGLTFSGADGLTEALRSDPRVATCFVQTARRWLSGAPACADEVAEAALTAPLTELSWERR